MTKIFSLSLALMSTVFVTACSKVQGQAEPPARPVKVQAVEVAPATPPLRYSATIQPDREVALAFKVSGYVDFIPQRRGADGRMRPLQAGDAIRAGETLARVREADYRERVNQVAGNIREVEAAQAKSKLDLDRARALFSTGSLTKPDLDAAQSAADARDAQLAAAQAQRALAEIALNEAVLTAPISGVVLERRVEIGALVAPGSAVFTIGQVAPVKAIIGVPDLHIGRVALGKTLHVMSEGAPGRTLDGIVTTVSPAADNQSRLFTIEIAIANQDAALRPGMIGTVEIPVTGAAAETTSIASLAIPLAAVVRSEKVANGYAVYVVEGGPDRPVARTRQVRLGEVRGNAVAVMQGLHKGESIVVSGPGMLVDGDRVRVIPGN
jgi:multidrug efflux system membrane fusion protein